MGATFSRWEGAFRNTGNVPYLDLGAAHMDVFTLLPGVPNTGFVRFSVCMVSFRKAQ